MARQYPEVQEELDQLEQAMFDFDLLSAQQDPSRKVKDSIFQTLEGDFFKQSASAAPAPEVPTETPVKALNPWKQYAAAASLIAVLSFAAALFYAFRYFEVEEKYDTLVAQQSQLAEDLRSNQVRLESLDQQMEKLLSGNYERVFMRGQGLNIQDDARVDVFWDRSSQSVFVSVSNLSELDVDSDYQLWAIGDNGPVGIGLVSAADRLSLQQMQAVRDASAFAITIEPKGGSPQPTLEKLVVLGEV
nr:anti-sigma factor [Lunatimonas salinarum]